ncbi:hypothetical protein WISP_74023 [Willisornis vidua]|uniref:Uncharacterized protein n=1 Tax=Willisornis vidua TaxID=1566151 RepID=A0ABQ9D7Y6_9PASS|nr:hypothetical protein WISP_74023 [Willisornis vidua]
MFLNTFMDEESTISLGNLCQGLTTIMSSFGSCQQIECHLDTAMELVRIERGLAKDVVIITIFTTTSGASHGMPAILLNWLLAS